MEFGEMPKQPPLLYAVLNMICNHCKIGKVTKIQYRKPGDMPELLGTTFGGKVRYLIIFFENLSSLVFSP